MRQTTAAEEVRLDEDKPPSSGLCEAERLAIWLSADRLRSNVVAAEPPGTEDHAELPENPGNVG
jgi:hypothetical protein